jgi:sigma-B regulation protein RsbU (phosphoserine phosphatase)
MIEGAAYKSATIDFAAGDRILILTDGFTEAADPADTLFGEAPIEALLAGIPENDTGALAALTAQVRAHEAGLPSSDDMAAILLWLEAGA